MKKTIFLFFAAILCATSASAWSYKTAANSWKASTSGFTWVTMNSGKSMDVVMLKDVGDGVNICQNDNGSGHTLYCKWTKTSGDIFRGTARWNNGLYSDETVVVPEGKVYITVGSGTQVQMTAGTNYTYTADVTFSTTGQSYTISGGTVSGATIKNENSMPSGGKPASLTMKNSYTSKTTGNVHIEFDLKTNKVIETAASEPDPEPEPTVTLYFVNHPEWTNLKAHVWDNNSTPYKDWNNSELMTNTGLDKDGYAVYSYTFPSKYTNIIFKGDGQQTQDNVAAYDVAKPYFCDDKWYASLAEIPALGAVVTYDYYVIGTVNSWALKDASHGMTDDNADGVYEKVVTLADGKNQMKINNGTWDKQAGYDQLDAKYEGVSRGTSGDDNNIIINIATGKDITVKFDKNTNKITLDGLTKIEDYYTVVGVADLFGEAWAPANEANKMVKQGDGSYKLVKENVTLAAIGYDWKIAKNGDWWNDAATGVNPSTDKNNTLTITTAGRYNVTFTLAADLKTAKVETELLEAAVVIPDCFISGNKNLTGKETEWQGNEFTMVYDEENETWSYTLAGLQPEKAYELKVVCGGTWYNYTNLASVPTGVTEGNDHSIAFKMAEAGDVTVKYNVEAGITLSGNFALPVTYDYYLTGTLVGGWSATQQGMEKEGDVYKATFTELNAGIYQFKITDGQFNTEEDKTHEHTTLAAAYKEVSYVDGNIQINTEEAINLTVIFDAATDKITFEGLTPVVVTYELKGVGGWEQPGIELVQNPDPEKASEYMLTCQAISATDAIKVVRLEDGVIKDYYGNGTVKDGVQVTVEYDDQANIKLPAGTYNFYFDTAEPEKKLWIEAATDCEAGEEIGDITELTMTNLVVTPGDTYDLLEASENEYGISVTLGVDTDGDLIDGSNVTMNDETELPINYDLSGKFTKSTDAENGDVYSGLVVVEFDGGLMGLQLTMYASTIEVTKVNLTGGTVTLNDFGAYVMSAKWDTEDVIVELTALEIEDWVSISIGKDRVLSGMATVKNQDGVVTLVAKGLNEYDESWTSIVAIYDITITATLDLKDVAVYFINTPKWTAPIYAYATMKTGWGRIQEVIAENAPSPGVVATKEDYQIAGYDVYSYTALEGTYNSVQFSGNEMATDEAGWESDMYYIHDFEGNSDWYTREEAEALLTPKTPDYTRTVTPEKFGTLCLPFGGTITGAVLYECVGSETGKVYLGSVTELEAGVPYIFQATATELAVYSDGTTAATPGDHNGLHGTFTDNTEVAVGNYILKDNAICEVAATCWVNAYCAYIVWGELPTGVPTQMPGRRYIGMGVHGENGTTGLDNIMTTDAPVKAIENGQLIIIRGGEKFNAQGVRL